MEHKPAYQPELAKVDTWKISCPIGRWYFGTDPQSEKKMRDKYSELLAKYLNMPVEKKLIKKGEPI